MKSDHPMRPPKHVVQKFFDMFNSGDASIDRIATAMYQAGADAELRACAAEVDFFNGKRSAHQLVAVRRPKKPSKKELAIQAIQRIDESAVFNMKSYEIYDDLRRDISFLCSVINSIPDNEKSNE